MTRKLFTTLVTVLAMVLLLGTVANAETTRPVILVDESYSSSYFFYEPFVTEYLDNVYAEVIKFGNGSKTMLYDQVQQAIDEGYTNIYIISDCWNTAGSAGVRQNNAGITLLTPYFESDKVDMHLYQVARKLNSSVPLKVYYWNEWPEIKETKIVTVVEEEEVEPEKEAEANSSLAPVTTSATSTEEEGLSKVGLGEILVALAIIVAIFISLDDKDEKEDEKKAVNKTVETLKAGLAEDAEKVQESLILGDCSGSMNRFQNEVLKRVKNAPDEKKLIFAEQVCEYKEIHHAKLGKNTDIVSALDHALDVVDNKAHLYLLTDLLHNSRRKFDEGWTHRDFHGVVTVVYYPNGYRENAEAFVQRMKEAMPEAKIEVC